MPMLTVSCPTCTKAAQIDSARLPDGPAYFPCPHCKGKVVVDRRQLLASPAAPVAAPTTPIARSEPRPPAAPSEATDAALSDPAPASRRIPKLPADAEFPSGIILGEDDAVVREVQTALSALGTEVDRVKGADAGRTRIIEEQPELCVFVGGKVPSPPYEPMKPLTGLPPNHRRKLYLVLVADNLKTLDGTAAFMYEVNMILGRADFSQLGAALYCGWDYHRRLYRPYLEAEERKGSF